MSTTPPFSGEPNPFGAPVQQPAKGGSGGMSAMVIILIIVGVVGLLGLASCGVLGALLLPAVTQARVAAQRVQDQNNLKIIGLAMHNLHAVDGQFPPSSLADASNQPTLSWRVALCKDLDPPLFATAQVDQSWDSPANQALLNSMPSEFKSPNSDDPSMTMSQYHIIAAPDPAPGMGGRTPFSTDPGVRRSFREFTDGTSNTVLAISLPSYSENWTEPGYLSPDEAYNRILESGGTNVLMADGSVIFVSPDISKNVWDGLTTIDGGELVSLP